MSSMAQKYKQKLWVVIGALTLIVVGPTLVLADSAISQGFSSEEPIPAGAIVSSATDKKLIEQATSDNAQKLLGVVSEGSLVELSSEAAKVQVVTSGLTSTFVSDLNGTVEIGDPITASPIVGVGMKADEDTYIVGNARASSDDAKEVSQYTIKDKNGNDKTVRVALLPVQVNVSYLRAQEDEKTILPQFLVNLAETVAGKDVSVLRVLVALLVLVAGVIAISTVLYSSVRSSILSIGRNPLAASAVNRSLLEVSFLALGILLVMLGAVYLILVV